MGAVMDRDCLKCARPANASWLCWDCIKSLRKLLLEIAELADELENTMTRQTAHGKSLGGKSAETPLVFEERASDTARIVLDTLGPYWAHPPPLGLSVYGKIEHCAWHLADTVTSLSRDEDAAGIYEEFVHARKLILKAIDTPVNLVPLGECECGRPVLTPPGKRLAYCACGNTFDVQTTRQKFKDMAREQLVTARQAESLGEIYGKRITRYAITNWVHRKRLAPVNTPGVENVYRFGDLLDLAQEVADNAPAVRVS